MKICISAILKNENVYLREWVEHYKALGIDHIFLYDNNDSDGENPIDVIEDYVKEGFVEINGRYRGKKAVSTRNKFVPKFQVDSYKEVYENIQGEYDFMMICDIDELFMFTEKYTDIHTYIEDIPSDIDVICVNWVICNDGDKIFVENGDYSMKNRLHETDFVHPNYKSIIRVKKLKDPYEFTCHSVFSRAKEIVYADQRMNRIALKYAQNQSVPSKSVCHFNHYKFKTLQEYIENKLSKWKDWGFVDNGSFDSLTSFFKTNMKNKEKLDYLREYARSTEDNRIREII